AIGAARLIGRERERLLAAVVEPEEGTPTPWDAGDGFQLSGARAIALPLDVDGEDASAMVIYARGGIEVTVDGVAAAADAQAIDGADGSVYVLRQGRQTVVRLSARDPFDAAHVGADGRVVAPMHGKLLEVLIARGDAVRKGQRLAVIEAMKMEHALTAPIDGV